MTHSTSEAMKRKTQATTMRKNPFVEAAVLVPLLAVFSAYKITARLFSSSYTRAAVLALAVFLLSASFFAAGQALAAKKPEFARSRFGVFLGAGLFAICTFAGALIAELAVP
jgi:hypothetical protein